MTARRRRNECLGPSWLSTLRPPPPFCPPRQTGNDDDGTKEQRRRWRNRRLSYLSDRPTDRDQEKEQRRARTNCAIRQGGNGNVEECRGCVTLSLLAEISAGKDHQRRSWERCLSRIYFPFWSKNLGVVVLAAAASDVVVISGDPHPSICKRGERPRPPSPLPLWGAEIGQWLGKHVPLPLSSSTLSLYLTPLYLTFTPFPRSQK